MDGMKAYKMSLVLDIACIIMAAVVLYCANNMVLPQGMLIAGAIVALLLLIAAVQQLMKARRIFKQEAEEYQKQMEQAKEEAKQAAHDSEMSDEPQFSEDEERNTPQE